jgi:hypothetical protein
MWLQGRPIGCSTHNFIFHFYITTATNESKAAYSCRIAFAIEQGFWPVMSAEHSSRLLPMAK